jgi:hypothetical protein
MARNRVLVILALLACLVAAARIASTWRVLNETSDEAYHIGCGMEWLHTGRYTYETQHPPLARVVAAIGVTLGGGVFHALPDAAPSGSTGAVAGQPHGGQPAGIAEGRFILDSAPDYLKLLAWARSGNLLFFLLACLGVWLLAARCGGAAVAAVSVAAFTLVPVVLGHAGLATTDMALTACLGLAFWCWLFWLDKPEELRRAALMGMATALAVVSKFSAVVFLPAAIIPVLVWRWRKRTFGPVGWPVLARTTLCAIGVFVLVCWAVYRFEVVPFRTPPGREFLLLNDIIGSSGRMHGFVYHLLELRLPLTGMLKGIGEVFQHNVDGHQAYLFGRVSTRGWWYFFPVALAVKTPVAYMLLVVLGAVTAIRARNRAACECLAAASAVLGAGMVSNLNIGVRHVLPVYLFATPLAGLALVHYWRSRKMVGLLGLWLAAGSAMAHPDYLADFNLLAMGKPEHILVDSDLDWGQDLHRATGILRQRGVGEAWLAYEGMAQPSLQEAVRYTDLPPGGRPRGWLVVSLRRVYYYNALARRDNRPEPYRWLLGYQPAARAGRSILIFDFSKGLP